MNHGLRDSRKIEVVERKGLSHPDTICDGIAECNPRLVPALTGRQAITDLNWMRMYTPGRVRALIRPLTVCVLLLFGAGPVATVACELACSTPNGHADHQASHHSHASPGVQPSDSTREVPSLRPPTSTCDHAIAVAPAVTSIAMKVFAPVATPALKRAAPERGAADVVWVRFASGGPPGVRSAPVSLRI